MEVIWDIFAVIGIVASLIMMLAGYVIWETKR